ARTLPHHMPLRLHTRPFFFERSHAHRDLHSFPTRRSSDLRHRDAVRAFFADKPDRLLEMCIDDTRDWTALRVYLDITSVPTVPRSEEHTSELQSRGHLVCRLLPEKKNLHISGVEYCA